MPNQSQRVQKNLLQYMNIIFYLEQGRRKFPLSLMGEFIFKKYTPYDRQDTVSRLPEYLLSFYRVHSKILY